MPTYRHRCPTHGDWDQWQSIRDSSRLTCPDCGTEAARVMVPPLISVYATPNKGADARAVDAREGRWDRDMPSYKALRRNGLQPRGIDGAHELEAKAQSQLEVEMGDLIPKEKLNLAADVNAELRESERLGGAPESIGRYVRTKATP